jgi:hypothetical protein
MYSNLPEGMVRLPGKERSERMSRGGIRTASPKREARTSGLVQETVPLVLASRFGLAGFAPSLFPDASRRKK